MSEEENRAHVGGRWARFRFSVVGSLLAAPPEKGELHKAIKALAQKTWRHPVTGEATRYGFATIERWYYRSKGARVDPVGALGRKVRSDLGVKPSMPEELRSKLRAQYKEHPSWSYQLHADNLRVVATDELQHERAPSYPTVRRFMKGSGLIKRRRRGPRQSESARQAELRFESREVRSYELSHVHGLWHADFHHGSRRVLTADGTRVTPILFGALDDRSRLCCHLQWYLNETAENFVHGLSQAFQKRALPRALMTDNGKPMTAAETEEGLVRLSIIHDPTLPYSPEQNAKKENFWGQIEGRLLPMLESLAELTLPLLNEATCAWVELEYNRSLHSEINEPPLQRYLASPEVGRPAPSSEELRRAFTTERRRKQRRSDGTLSLDGVRFEVPSRYRHIERLTLRYARWDLSCAWITDARTDTVICPIYPLDKERNANGQRRTFELIDEPFSAAEPPAGGIAPLLKKLIADYAAFGLPPAYLPKDELPHEPAQEAEQTTDAEKDEEDHHG